MRKLALSLALTLALAACASGPRAGAPAAPRRNPNVITAEEIAGAHAQNALDVVRQLRPRFLMTQGGTTRTHAVQVMVDEVPRGGVSVLGGINAGDVVEIRYLDASEATMKYGTGYTGGIIFVKTLAGGRS